MRCSHHRAILRCQKHRQAIGHHDGTGQATLRCHASIGPLALRTGCVQLQRFDTMHLVHENHVRTCDALQDPTIFSDRSRQIANMVAQVHAVKRHS